MRGGQPPDFEALVGGDDLEPAERERLRRVHDLLVAAGPPAELPPTLVASEQRGAAVVPFRRPSRRRLAVVGVLAAALAIAAFGTGYFVGSAGDSDEPDFVLPMSGSGASASLAVYPLDEAGNWPMKMTIRGLPPLPRGQRYELWLTQHGRLAASCGRFVVGEGRTIVALNAPYRLRAFDGWVVTKAGSDEPLMHTT